MAPIALNAVSVGNDEIAAVLRVMRSGHLVQGAEVAAFEDEFSRLVAGWHCVAVNSGTAALHLCLLACDIGPGAEVIVPSFTFGATAHAVVITGATPIFADIDPSTFCLDPRHVASLITDRTAAIMPVHLFGHPADMTALMSLAKRHGLAVIEDAAQAVGAAWQGRPVGTFADAGCFSFYPTKNMHSIEGGMITTRSAELAATLRLLRNQGMSARYEYALVGLNARMTDVSAAVGRVQLASLSTRTLSRQSHATWLDANLREVITPPVREGATHVYHQYVIRVQQRDRLAERLRHKGIETAVHYPLPVHRSHAYRSTADLPHSEAAARQVLSIPVHPGLSPEDIRLIAEAVNGE